MRPVTPQTAQPAARVGGVKPRYGVVASEKFQMRFVPDHLAGLKRIATEYNTTPTAIIRDAVDQIIGDYGEGCLFITVGKPRA